MSCHDNALVVKKKSTSTFLVIIKKRWVVGNFFTAKVPAVGDVIAVDWKCCPSERDTIDVFSWQFHEEPMGGFLVNDLDGAIQFTGMFYTTGCVILCGVPLENPAVFNNFIGVVEDKTNALQKDYIGKLKATVTFGGGPGDYHWTLCTVDKYYKTGGNEVSDQPLPYRGVVGAVKKGYTHAVNFITSRYFPKDVRFFTGINVSAELVDTLLGREVYFDAVNDERIEQSSCVAGPLIPITTYDLNYSRDGDFFKVDVIVEYIGCTDEYGNTIVWSDKLEFVVDSDALFKGLAYGLYRVIAARHYKKEMFTKWRVKKVRQLIKSLTGVGVHVDCSLRSSPPMAKQSGKQDNSNGIRNRSAGHGSDKKLDISPKSRDTPQDSGVVDVLEESVGAVGRPSASTGRCREEMLTPEEDVEKTLRTCLYRCLESIKVRASIKQADPVFFDSLVAALMRV